MARKSDTTETVTTEDFFDAEQPVTETVENGDEAQVEVPVEAEVEAEVTPEPEVVIDLTAFETATTEAIAASDSATGVVPESGVEAVRNAYQALPGVKGKNKAKAHLQGALSKAIDDLEVGLAKAYSTLLEDAAVAGKSTTTKAPADPAAALTEKVATLTLALYLAGSTGPEGVDLDAVKAAATQRANDAFESALAVYNTDEQVTEDAFIKGAITLAAKAKARKGRGPSEGPNRDVAAHITQAFEGKDVGTFLTVAQIRNFESAEYGTEKPSSGAISNRIQPKSGKPTTVAGIAAEERSGILGAVKVS